MRIANNSSNPPIVMPDIPYYLIGLSLSVILLTGIVVIWRRRSRRK
ncbi:MAG: hypothetical protein H7211_10150 [Aquabacterium sp.]|nr:hypothetical protein [Ferruginibacter sp.]